MSYYNRTDSSGSDGFLPTVVFTSPNNIFTDTLRSTQLAALGITGFYEANFADNITIIGPNAFSPNYAGDSKLVAVSINKVTTIRDYAFYNCMLLRSIILDCAVDVSGKYLLTSIGIYAFYRCEALRSIYIPDTVKSITDGMCFQCANLEVVVFGYGCDRTDTSYNRSGTIGRSAFQRCYKLSSIVIPETISSIDDAAFGECPALALVYILGRPTFVTSNVFAYGSNNAIYYYDNSASYTDLTAVTSTSLFPTNATKRPYREIDLSAGGAATLTSTHVNSAIGSYNSFWKGKILGSVTSLADNCFRGQTAGTDGIGTTNYSNMIGISFPTTLTSIGYAAFCNSDGTNANPPACRVGGFYIPNSVSTFGVSGVSGDTFWFTNLSGQNLATTKQFVFQSGRTSPITTLPARMFQYTSAMAVVIPSFTNIGASCFQFARYIQYFNFFQKNAYTTLTKLDGETTDSAAGAFSNCFNALTSRTHYLYIPKAVTRISDSAFADSTNPLFITVYSSTTDGSTGTGLCATTNFLTSTYFSGTVAPTFFLINNYYDANGLILGTFVPTTGTYHVLLSSGVRAIDNRYAGSGAIRSIAIDPSAQPIVINDAAFQSCPSLNFVYLNSRAKSIGLNAFRNTPLSNTFDLSWNTSLEAIYSGAFYTDNGNTSNLRQITIPSSVKVLGSRAFGSSTVGRKPLFATLSVGSGIAFWGDYDNTLSTASTTAAYEVLDTNSLKYMAIPAFFCENCDFLTSVSFLDTVNANGTDITTPPDIASPITRLNKQTLIPAIKRIGTSAFVNNQRLQSIRIPDGVTTVDASGFFNAHSLSCLYLPDSLTTIGLDAFKNFGSSNKFYAGNPVSIRIPQSRIGDVSNNFFDASGGAKYFTVSFDNTYSQVTNGVLQRFTSRPVENTIFYNVILQSSITGILTSSTANAGSFNGYTTLKSVNIPAAVTDIGEYTFNGCTGLVNVFLAPNSNLVSIGPNAFRNIHLNSSFDLSGATSLQAIYSGAFYTDAGYTSGLTRITIPSSVKVLGSRAFGSSAVGLKLAFTSLSVGSGIEFWGDYDNTLGTATTTASYEVLNTSSLKYMAIPANFCENCDFLTSVSFLDTVDANGAAITADTNLALTRPDNGAPITTRLNKQTLSYAIKRIATSAFLNNQRLQSIRIPDGVTTIDASGFSNAHSLSYLYLPNSLTTIGLNAFNNLGAANKFLYTGKQVSVRIPQSRVDDISTNKFSTSGGSTYFFTVSFDSTYSKVSGGVLQRFTSQPVNSNICYNLILQSDITGILSSNTANAGAFNGYTTLTSVNIPDAVTDISGNTFSGCTGLVNLFVSPTSNLTVVGDSAFQGDVSLTSFFFPNSVRGINKSTFSGCTNLASIKYGDNPSIKYIDASGFYNATNKLTSIYIPSSVVSIGSQAFINSTTQNNLASVTFGAGSRLKSIGGGCFGSNTSTYAARFLKDIVLPNSVRCIGTGLSGGLVSDATTSNVFRNAFTLSHSDNLILPSSLESLSNWFLFTDSSNVDISNVYLPKSITNVAGPRKHCGYTTSGLGGNEFSPTTIGSRAGSLLYLPSELAGYTPSSFPGLNRTRSYYKTVSYTDNPLLTLSLSGSVANTTDAINTTQIHADIKEGVVVIGGGTTSIDMSGSVDGSLNLISVNIPSTVTDICANAFNGCNALTYVTFSENSHLTTIGQSAFSACTNIQDIKLPDTVTTIGQNAFNGCNNLATISIPYNVRSIGLGAFTNSTLILDASFQWITLGAAAAGAGSSQEVGRYIALSSDGTTVAMTWHNPYTNPATRTVIVYRRYNSSWIKLGSNIDGSTIISSMSNASNVSLSSDGNTVAIGYNSDTNYTNGISWVQVFKYYNSAWNIVGNVTDLSGANGSGFGRSVSLSSDGTIVACGIPEYNNAKGLVQVFKYNNSRWNMLGNATDLSNSVVNRFGYSLSLSSDGTTLAIGALTYFGLVQVFKYNNSKWNMLGNATDLSGPVQAEFGRSVSLSSDGTTIAIGSPAYPSSQYGGLVNVFKYNNSKWNMLGNATDLSGSGGMNFGFSVDLSPDGTTLAVGTDSQYGSDGYVKLFKYTSSWSQINNTIYCPFYSERATFGHAVALSSDGSTVAIGSRGWGAAYIFNNKLSSLKSVQMPERLYNDISGSLGNYISVLSASALQVIPELRLTNTLNPSKLTISQINNMYIRYRQSQLGCCTRVTVSASSGGQLTSTIVNAALSGITGFVHLEIDNSITVIQSYCVDSNYRSQIYSVAIPKTVQSISDYAFIGCTNITYLSFHPDSICNIIWSYAFHGNRLFDLALPDTITHIYSQAFKYSYNLTSVCIPPNITYFGGNVFSNCPKLTSINLPDFQEYDTTDFNKDGTTSTKTPFTTYSPSVGAIPHFKLTDYSMPNGIVQNVVDSAVTYIDHLAYAYYPDITLYAVTTNKQTQTAGQYNYVMNGIKMPFQPAAFLLNGSSTISNAMFPIYRSVPDLNAFSLSNPGTATAYWADNTDDFYLLMPGYSICVYNNLYDEENLFADTPTFRYYDNEFGKAPLNIDVSGGVSNTTSSILIMYKGRILSKYFTT